MRTLCWMLVAVALGGPSLARGEAWDQIGPNGAWVNDMTRGTNDAILATGNYGGVHRSTDDGESWTRLDGPDDLPTLFDARCVATNAAGHIFVGADGFVANSGIVRSTDDGATWQILSNTLSTRLVIDLLVTTNQNLFACTGGNGVYRSTNNGATFTSVAGLPSLPAFIKSNANGDLFVGAKFASVNLYASTDGGATWTARDTGISFDVEDLAMDPGNPSVMYAAGGNKVYKTTNGGVSWTDFMAPSVFSYTGVAATANGDVYAANYAGILAGGGKVFHTTNQGGTWTEDSGLSGHPLGQFLQTADWLFLEVVGPGPNRLGIALRSSGAVWEQKANGMHNLLIREVVPDEAGGRIYAIAEGLGIFGSADAGLTWEAGSGIPSHEFFYSMVVGSSGMYATGAYNGIYKSTNGLDWTAIFGLTASALAMNDLGHVYAGYGNRLYCSTDQGANWPQIAILPGVQQIKAIACDGTDIYVATSNNGVYYSTNTFRSSWATINTGLPNLSTTSIAVDQDWEMACKVSVGLANGGLYEFDGQTWHHNFGSGKVTRVRKYDSPQSAGFTVMDDELWRTDDTSPCQYDRYLGEFPPFRLAADVGYSRTRALARGESPFVLIVGTYGEGLWRSDGAAPTGVAEILPRSKEVLSVGRNPFEQSTRLEFELTRPGVVDLEVFDVSGRLVTTLTKGWRSAGSHTVTWDAAGQSSGVYFTRLSTGDAVHTRRLVLVR